MRKILIAGFLLAFYISSAHNSIFNLTNKTSAAITTVDDKDFCSAISKIAKKIKGKSANKMESGQDNEVPTLTGFDVPYFNSKIFGPHFYELSYRAKIKSNANLMELYKKYQGVLDGCKDLKFDKTEETSVSKIAHYDYSKNVFVQLKADMYHNYLTIYILRAKD